MRRKPDHWLLNSISQDEYQKVLSVADNKLINNSLKKCCDIEDNFDFEENEKLIYKVIDSLELAAIELQREALNEGFSYQNDEFTKICHDLFILLRSLPLPNDEIEKIKHIYKLITYSYLGERWQEGRRYLIENKDLWDINIEDEQSWDKRLFKKIYLAFLYLVRKKNWKDLDHVCKLVEQLREEQEKFEQNYISDSDTSSLEGKAYELFGLYHLAKVMEMTAQYMTNGEPSTIREKLDFHFDKAIKSANKIANIEMDLILRMLDSMLHQMIKNSIWMVTQRVNSRVTRFIKSITKSDQNPVFELLYPQRTAILDNGLLNPAHKAVVINMPTSSGKTLLSEFRILQALNQFSEIGGWIAYVAPTRALVNQISRRLKKDLEPIGVKVEKMSGALEVDLFEENLLSNQNEDKKFDILVTTPEKLNLLIRNKLEEKVKSSLVLTVIDEAHNLEDDNRGLNYELLMANIKNDCSKSNFLLLTPFIKNSDEIARWLDPDSPKDISIGVSWKPNDRIIGAIHPEGRAREWKTKFKTLLTNNERIQIEKDILISNETPIDETRSALSKGQLTMAVSKQLIDRKGILVIGRTIPACWKIAASLSDELNKIEVSPEIELVKKYITSELGENFILNDLIEKGIGVHHAGLPDEVKNLMEWLMSESKLRVLVSTTTIAQGINFPVSTILMASYAYPYTSHMPIKDFWNLIGRCGRIGQGTLGMVGIAVGPAKSKMDKDMSKLKEFIGLSAEKLVSNLKEMVEEIVTPDKSLDLTSVFYDNPKWSQFLQYIAHMYNQSQDLLNFNTEAELFLRQTFGYNTLDKTNKEVLLKAVKVYGSKLNDKKETSMLSDSTGFSPETISYTMSRVRELGLNSNSWEKSNLFSNKGDLKSLMGVMLSIPEIKDNLKISSSHSSDGETLANIINDWVGGDEIKSIAKNYFGGENQEAITKSCKAVYQKIINAATWGLSSLQKMPGSGLDFDNLSDEEKRDIENLPAMIYYGVNTDQAILMRKNNIPRSIANQLGDLYENENEDIYNSSSDDVAKWLNSLSANRWPNETGAKVEISGEDYKKIWKILNEEQ